MNGVACATLVDVDGMAGMPELHSRLLAFAQPFDSYVATTACAGIEKRLRSHTAWASHVIADVIGCTGSKLSAPSWDDRTEPPWVAGLPHRASGPGRGLHCLRTNTGWSYYTIGDNALTVVELSKSGVADRRRSLA